MELKFKNSSTNVHFGNAWSLLDKLLPEKEAVIITDANVYGLYGDHFPDYPVVTIGTGEVIKEPDTVVTIIKHLLAIGADRSTFLLGIGGGIVCDITGFVASIYMRGLEFGFVSTTLLSQVDASLGGKNGVNINGIKNIIGCFTQPSFVICDVEHLKTLSEDDYISGTGELLKHALILDKELFNEIEKNIPKIAARNNGLMKDLISRSISLKARIVMEDEKEKGERRLLNFGHTLGHAIEATTGLSHGISVARGMMVAAEISMDEGLLSGNELKRIRSVMEFLELLKDVEIAWPEIHDIIRSDKKKSGDDIYFILLDGIGKGIQRKYSIELVTDMIRSKIN